MSTKGLDAKYLPVATLIYLVDKVWKLIATLKTKIGQRKPCPHQDHPTLAGPDDSLDWHFPNGVACFQDLYEINQGNQTADDCKDWDNSVIWPV